MFSNAGATRSVISGFKIAEAEKLIVSETTPSAVIVNVALNIPAASGLKVISTAPLDLLAIANALSPVSSTSTLFAFATEKVTVLVAVSPT